MRQGRGWLRLGVGLFGARCLGTSARRPWERPGTAVLVPDQRASRRYRAFHPAQQTPAGPPLRHCLSPSHAPDPCTTMPGYNFTPLTNHECNPISLTHSYEVLQRLRAMTPHVHLPIIMVSAQVCVLVCVWGGVDTSPNSSELNAKERSEEQHEGAKGKHCREGGRGHGLRGCGGTRGADGRLARQRGSGAALRLLSTAAATI